MIQRWGLNLNGNDMPDALGKFVLYSDYAALQASHKELVEALRPCLGHLADYLDKCGPNKAQPTLENAIAVIEKAEKLTK